MLLSNFIHFKSKSLGNQLHNHRDCRSRCNSRKINEETLIVTTAVSPQSNGYLFAFKRRLAASVFASQPFVLVQQLQSDTEGIEEQNSDFRTLEERYILQLFLRTSIALDSISIASFCLSEHEVACESN